MIMIFNYDDDDYGDMMISNYDGNDDDDYEENQVVFDLSTHIAFPALLTEIFLDPANEGIIKSASVKVSINIITLTITSNE